MNPNFSPVGRCAIRVLALLILSSWPLVAGLAAADAAKAKVRNTDGNATTDAKAAKREEKLAAKTDGGATTDAKAAKREEKLAAKNDPGATGEAESRQLTRLRERLGVTDDAEWAVVAERIAKVEEARRNLAQDPNASRPNAANARRNGRPTGSDYDALRAAVTDQYPDAEIKARLARAHEARQKNEAQLLQAQTELRAVLSVRQEAIVVMAGLLPP